MKRHLLLLNLVLAVLLVAGIVVLRNRWIAAEQKRAEILKAASAAGAVKKSEEKTAAEQQVRAASYFELVDKMLFSKDRNATVIVEIPQEKPMPPLPSAFGVMNLGTGPVAFLAMKGESQRAYQLGESIGEFKLTEATPTDLTFEWEGKTIKRRLEELRAAAKETAEKPSAAPAAAAPVNAPAAPASVNASATPTDSSPSKGAPKMGGDVNASSKYCDPSDTTPDGTVSDGFRKVTRRTPFSSTCFWEKVQ